MYFLYSWFTLKTFVNNRKGENKKELKWCTKLVVQLTYHINTTMLFHYCHTQKQTYMRGLEVFVVD